MTFQRQKKTPPPNSPFIIQAEVQFQEASLKEKDAKRMLINVLKSKENKKKQLQFTFHDPSQNLGPGRRHLKKKMQRNVNDVPKTEKKTKKKNYFTFQPTSRDPSQSPYSGRCSLKKKWNGTLMTFQRQKKTKRKENPTSQLTFHDPSWNPDSGRCPLKKNRKGTLIMFPMAKKNPKKPSSKLTFVSQAEIWV